MMPATTHTPTPGFSRPVLDAQQTFRLLLDALAMPGLIVEIPDLAQPPAPLHGAAGALCLTLADMDTPVWIDSGDDGPVGSWLRFHCNCPLVDDHSHAALAVLTDAQGMPPLDSFRLGDPQYPDRSATLVVQVDELAEDRGWRLIGPGIESERRLSVQGLPDSFPGQREALAPLYPLGVDVFFVAGSRVAGLPRTTRIEVI